MSQAALLRKPRFGPFFLTQFLGAFNDTLFKQSLALLFAFHSATKEEGELLVQIVHALFILPFFLFSATAGQLADKHDKASVARLVKVFEIGIMLVAGAGFLRGSTPLLLAGVVAMGVHSTLFGPVKYSILPQHLREEELVGGNGLIEMGTFIAILLGTILAGIYMGFGEDGIHFVAATVLCVAVIGYSASRAVPKAPPPSPELKIDWNPFTASWRSLSYARENRAVLNSILGISWFWFYGAVFLNAIPTYAKYALGAGEQVVTVLLVCFSVGVGTGSLLCERMSGSKIEIGLVPFGAIGLTIFPVVLAVASPWEEVPGGDLDALGFLAQPHAPFIVVSLVMIGLFAGFYIVPLFALVQKRSAKEHRSQIIAANNIVNAFFMVAAAILSTLLRRNGVNFPGLFLVTAALNGVVAIYIFNLVPEFLMRFLVWMLMVTMYRLDRKGIEKIPDEGAAVLVCNHVSFVDAMVISAACRRPIRFVMYHRIFKIPVLSFVFKTARAIPIAPRHEDEQMMQRAFDEIALALSEGELVCIFPEGKITFHGQMNEFKKGVERILERTPVPVYPLALSGLWGSWFSRAGGGKAFLKRPRRFWSRITLACGDAIAPIDATAPVLQERVLALRGERL